MKLKIQLALLALLAILNDATSQTTIVLKENFNYVGGSMHVGDEITIGSSQIKIQRVNGKISELTISERDPYTGEIILNYYGFTVVMKYLPSQKKIYWAWSSTDFGWFYFETLKERNAREARENIEREKREAKELAEQVKKDREAKIILDEKIKTITASEDKIEKGIVNMINNDDYVSALKTYLKYKGNISLNLDKYKETITAGVINQLKTDTLTWSKERTELLITNWAKKINSLPSNSYFFYFGTDGICIRNNFFLDSTQNQKIKNDFVIPNYLQPTKFFGVTLPISPKIGDKFMGGKIIEISENRIKIASEKPFDGNYYESLDYYSKISNNDVCWRLPTAEELSKLLPLYKHRCNEVFWTNQIEVAKALVINNKMSTECKYFSEWCGLDYSNYSFYKIMSYAVSEINTMSIPVNSKCIINVDDKEDIVLGTKFFTSGNKIIYQKDDSLFYYKTNNQLPQCNYNIDPTVPTGKVKLVREKERSRKANGIYVLIEFYKEEEIHSINKKYNGNKIKK